MTDMYPFGYTPSQRVHRFFHRVGIVFCATLVLMFLAMTGLTVYYYITGNPTAANSLAVYSATALIAAILGYITSRIIGWIIAGAMRY